MYELKLDNFIQEEFVFENDGDKFDLGQGEAHNSDFSTENMVLMKYQIWHCMAESYIHLTFNYSYNSIQIWSTKKQKFKRLYLNPLKEVIIRQKIGTVQCPKKTI